MKEETKIRRGSKSFKGSVLFTVVAVMMVMIVFVMATLTIAGVANQRAYDSYSKNQATYTARSAIESVYTAMSDTTDTTLADAVKNLGKGSTLPIGVTLPDQSMGTLKDGVITAECLNTSYTQMGIDTSNAITNSTKDVVKITATVVLGNEESTVSAYYLKDPDSVPQSIFKNALTTMGSASAGTSPKAYGGANIGIENSKWADETNKALGYAGPTAINNNGVMTADLLINGSASSNAQTTFQFDSAGQGMVILGDLTMINQPKFTSTYTVDSTTNYNDVPYIYVEGTFNYNLNDSSIGTASNPINVYIGGNINVSTKATFYSDVYIYAHDFSKDSTDEPDDSNVVIPRYSTTPVTTTVDRWYPDYVYNNDWLESDGYTPKSGYEWLIYSRYASPNTVTITSTGWDTEEYLSKFNGSNGSSLLNWANQLVTNSDGLSKFGGNLFSKGSVEIAPTNDTTKIEGDVYIGGDAHFKNVNIAGSLTCDGKIVFEGNNIVNGGISVADVSQIVFINGGKVQIGGTWYDENNKASIPLTTGTTFPPTKELKEILGYGDPNNKLINDLNEIQNQYIASNGYYKIGKLDVNELTADEINTIQSNADTKNTLLDESTCDNTIITLGNGRISNIEVTKQELADDGVTLVTNTYTYWDGSPEVNAYYKTVTLNGVETNVVYIDKNCTIKGNVGGNGGDRIVYIDPSATAGLWIKVEDLSFNAQGGCIVVNDSNPNSTANFYIEDNSTLDLNKGYIFTKSYYEKWKSGTGIDIPATLTANSEYIPNIYIYSGKNNTKLSITNNGLVTAYVVAPYLTLNQTNGGSWPGGAKYKGENITGELTIIGSGIVGDFNGVNDAVFMFVDPSGSSGGTGGTGSSGDWALLYYQNG